MNHRREAKVLPANKASIMIFSVIAQLLDATFGFPTGFDVVADHIEQYVEARKFILTLKFVG